MLVQCQFTVYDAGPALKQNFVTGKLGLAKIIHLHSSKVRDDVGLSVSVHNVHLVGTVWVETNRPLVILK